MLKNTSDSPLSFKIDGTKHTAAPRGAVTPPIPPHKEDAVLAIAGLPLESDKPKPEATEPEPETAPRTAAKGSKMPPALPPLPPTPGSEPPETKPDVAKTGK